MKLLCAKKEGENVSIIESSLFVTLELHAFFWDRILHSFYTEGVGTDWLFMTDAAAQYGIHASELGLDEAVMKQYLNQGHPIICAMRPAILPPPDILSCSMDMTKKASWSMIPTAVNAATDVGTLKPCIIKLKIYRDTLKSLIFHTLLCTF